MLCTPTLGIPGPEVIPCPWQSTVAIIVGEGRRAGYLSVVPDYGNNFRLFFACRPGSRNLQGFYDRPPVTWPIPALFRMMATSRRLYADYYPVARTREEYDGIIVRSGDMSSYFHHLFRGINGDTFLLDTDFEADIIIPSPRRISLDDLIETVQQDRYMRGLPYYKAILVFVARGNYFW